MTLPKAVYHEQKMQPPAAMRASCAHFLHSTLATRHHFAKCLHSTACYEGVQKYQLLAMAFGHKQLFLAHVPCMADLPSSVHQHTNMPRLHGRMKGQKDNLSRCAVGM